MHLGAGEGGDHQRPIGELAERRVEELRRGQIALVQILEQDHERRGGALGGEQVLGEREFCRYPRGLPPKVAAHALLVAACVLIKAALPQ